MLKRKPLSRLFLAAPCMLFFMLFSSLLQYLPTQTSVSVYARTKEVNVSSSEIIARARKWVTANVPYTIQGDEYQGYREDCSGFVTMAWGTIRKPSWRRFIHRKRT